MSRTSPACLGVSGDVHVHVTGMKGRGRYHTTFAACRTRDGARTTPLHEHTLDPRRARKPTRLSGHTPLGNKQMAEGSTGSRRPCARAVPSSRALQEWTERAGCEMILGMAPQLGASEESFGEGGRPKKRQRLDHRRRRTIRPAPRPMDQTTAAKATWPERGASCRLGLETDGTAGRLY